MCAINKFINSAYFTYRIFCSIMALKPLIILFYLAHLASRKPKVGICFPRILKYIFSDFFQTNYLNIHWTDLYEICRNGRTLSVDERPVIFFGPSRDIGMEINFLLTESTPYSSSCYVSETA